MSETSNVVATEEWSVSHFLWHARCLRGVALYYRTPKWYGDYFSGHCQRYGYNIQVMCDENLRITYLSVAGPGGKNDARVFRRLTRLRHWLMDLSAGYFIAGDNSYPLLKNVLIPFSGAAARVDCNDVYNFYLSQLHIRVEMTLGRLTCKWRIFRKNLPDQNGCKKNTMIIRVGAKLHNYVINGKLSSLQ